MEVFIMGSILGLLTVVAFPSYLDKKAQETATELAEQFRTYGTDFQTYRIQCGHWPPDQATGKKPMGMEDLLNGFTNESTTGGQWDWQAGTASTGAAIDLIGSSASKRVMNRLDQLLDDGNPESGHLIQQEGRIKMLLD